MTSGIALVLDQLVSQIMSQISSLAAPAADAFVAVFAHNVALSGSRGLHCFEARRIPHGAILSSGHPVCLVFCVMLLSCSLLLPRCWVRMLTSCLMLSTSRLMLLMSCLLLPRSTCSCLLRCINVCCTPQS